jgi:hypothetical protein
VAGAEAMVAAAAHAAIQRRITVRPML